MGVSGSKETDLFILTAQSKVDELGKGRRIVLPQSGALSKARALKSASKRTGRAAGSRPRGAWGLGEHGGPSDGEAQTARSPPVGLKSTDRRIWPRPFSLPSGQAAHGDGGMGPPCAANRARRLLAPGLRGPRAMPDRAPPGRGAIRPSLGECPPRAVLLTLPWPAASLAPRPGRCRYR